jgi:hypothetical protein
VVSPLGLGYQPLASVRPGQICNSLSHTHGACLKPFLRVWLLTTAHTRSAYLRTHAVLTDARSAYGRTQCFGGLSVWAGSTALAQRQARSDM